MWIILTAAGELGGPMKWAHGVGANRAAPQKADQKVTRDPERQKPLGILAEALQEHVHGLTQ